MIEQFKADVRAGLTSSPKTLPSKYFYDAIGDALFVKIMHMPEYYLTRAEFEIFSEKADEIIQQLSVSIHSYFELIELGAGDGTKTKKLLAALSEGNFSFDYLPVDISEHALNGLESMLAKELPKVNVKIQQGDYFEVLASLKNSPHPKIIFFLGSNIGNLKDQQAGEFIYKLGSNLRPGDKLLLGVDLIKPRDIVLPAYNDPAGVTAAFNLNLLTRINKEMGANFVVESFEHFAEYTEEEGIAKSSLVSSKEQKVHIEALDLDVHFKAGEKIHTEISRKYNDKVLSEILDTTDFKMVARLTDSKSYFANYVLERTP